MHQFNHMNGKQNKRLKYLGKNKEFILTKILIV